MFREQSVTHGHKLVNIASIVAKLGNICFRGAKSVSETRVSRVAKLGNICVRNNVSSLARP